MFKTFQGLVVQVDMGNLNIVLGKTFNVNHKTMVLRGDFHLAGYHIFDRMVGAVMAEF